MKPQATGVPDGREPGLLSPCVRSTLRMVSRAVTQLYDDILRPSGLRVTQFSILVTIVRSGEANLRQLEAALARWTRQSDAAHAEGQTGADRCAAALGPGPGQGAEGPGHEGLG